MFSFMELVLRAEGFFPQASVKSLLLSARTGTLQSLAHFCWSSTLLTASVTCCTPSQRRSNWGWRQESSKIWAYSPEVSRVTTDRVYLRVLLGRKIPEETAAYRIRNRDPSMSMETRDPGGVRRTTVQGSSIVRATDYGVRTYLMALRGGGEGRSGEPRRSMGQEGADLPDGVGKRSPRGCERKFG